MGMTVAEKILARKSGLKKTGPGDLVTVDVDTVIAVGESTSGCLRATVVEGTSHRFRMVVAEECAFDRHESAHAMNLFDMHQKYADVVDRVYSGPR